MIDFHCHLDLYPDPKAVAAKCHEAGVYVLSVTTTPKAWRGTLKIADGYGRIRTALGLHPQLAHERAHEVPLFEGLLDEAKYVGEIGLDGTPEFKKHWEIQISVFDRILKATSKKGGRTMSVHSRRAVDHVLDAFERYPNAGTPVMHWFSGTKRQLERAVSLGCWFSVGPAMLKAKSGSELASAMPKDRVLTETDGPFGSVGNIPLQPSDTGLAVKSLSQIWNEPAAAVEQRLRENLYALAKLSDDSRT